MVIFERLRAGEPVDMKSEDYHPAITELHRANLALYRVNHTEPKTKWEIVPQFIQVEAHPYFTQPELRKTLDKYGIKLMAWYPLGHGDKSLINEPIFAQLGDKYGKSPAQVILRWHTQIGFVVIPGSRNVDHNELIVGKALKDIRGNVVIATKLFLREGGDTYKNIRKHLLASMDRLQTDHVDLCYLHRMGGTPVERVAEAMGRLIDDGLIRGWGVSQVDVDIIDRAQQVTPLAAIQNIYSMVERDSEAGIIPYCMEHNIGFVPFSPIASGLLSGKITPQTQFEKSTFCTKPIL